MYTQLEKRKRFSDGPEFVRHFFSPTNDLADSFAFPKDHGDECAAALFVLMGTLENSTHPKLLANVVKHFAFTVCSESNLYGIVDAQIAVFKGELLVRSVTP